VPPKKGKPPPPAAPAPRSPGQPTKYEPRYCEELVRHMEMGYSFESFAGRIGVHRDTLYAWAEAHVEFSDAKKVGTEKSRYFWEGLGLRAAAGVSKINPAVWIFAMKNRFGWRDRIETETEHKGGIEVVVKDWRSKKADAESDD
jgi:hypothetical protein